MNAPDVHVPRPTEPPAQPLTAHFLGAASGRRAFLHSLFWDYQESGLLMAVQHVWHSLAGPRAVRCRAMAMQLGLPGTGKVALRRVLQRFLHEMNWEIDFPDLPSRAAYDDLEEWNRACLQHFADVDEQFTAVIDRYAAILDGRPDVRDVR